MTERWFTENWNQLMGGTDELLHEARHNVVALHDQSRLMELLQQAEQQRDATAAALRAFGEQRQALIDTLDTLQSELAVAGRPLQGEVS